MKFTKVKINKEHEVTLIRLTERPDSKDTIETSGQNPLPSFIDAVQAFVPFFLEVVPALADEKDNLRVTTISLGEKDGARSLQVSVSLAVEACGGAAISMTTPRLVERSADAADDDEEGAMALPPGALKLIANVEHEAERYVNGETAQGDLFKGDSANAKAVDERMGAAEVASTRKPRHQRSSVAGAIGTQPSVM